VTESAPSFDELRAALRRLHRRLADMVESLSDDAVRSPSYDTEWTIAQVLSHVGSGAEIFSRFINAGLGKQPVPGQDDFPPIWERWNDKDPLAQARDAVRAGADFVELVDAITPAEAADWTLTMFGAERRLDEVVRMRLNELAVHSWDVAVMANPTATVDDVAVTLMIDGIDQLAARVGKPPAEPFDVVVETTAPARLFRLRSTADTVELAPAPNADDSSPASLSLPAEALIRLVYGRLDEAHTPALDADGVDLSDLRATFPGV
jgi:uncharacterized protein (TIGR03083 family)